MANSKFGLWSFKLGISYAQIGRYEAKDAQSPAKTLAVIADVLVLPMRRLKTD
ncbi:MAG: hypothetical protein ABJF11_03340 [Reichenbachiella sp.]|uniref:hypothetical protein n=1 Tax=Reichenbachiella sp. TaxID=2184521 RepID=UPI003267833E